MNKLQKVYVSTDIGISEVIYRRILESLPNVIASSFIVKVVDYSLQKCCQEIKIKFRLVCTFPLHREII